MKRLVHLYCRLLDVLNAGLLLGFLVLVFGNVVLRYGFNSGILISEELSRWLIALPRRRKVALMISADLLALPMCFAFALFLRVGNFELLAQYGITPPLIIAACTIPVFSLSGLYRTVVRYFDLKVLWTTGTSLACRGSKQRQWCCL